MESPVNGVDSLSEVQNSVSGVHLDPLSSGTPLPSRPPLRAPRNYEGGHQTKTIHHQNSHVTNQKHSYQEGNNLKQEGLQTKLSSWQPPPDDSKGCESNGVLESKTKRAVDNHAKSYSQPEATFCSSPQNSFYSATVYSEPKESFTNTEVSECASVDKSCESEVANSSDFNESRKTSICRESTGSDASDESSTSSLSSVLYKPHKANDIRWEAIQAVRTRDGMLEMRHFRLLKKLGCGDIGSVYLAELSGTRTSFAMKVMNKTELANRKKLLRAQTEREILQSLDHPFLPTLYTHFETEIFSCLVMEFCPGGDLHALRQRQPGKFFSEHAVRFYVAEVLLALEYLHMLGIIYRDLKPENVLVREDGHIMLSDFDLSLRCTVSPTLVKSSNNLETKSSGYCVQPSCIEPTCVMQPDCIRPSCFTPRFLSGKSKKDKRSKPKNDMHNQVTPLPELIAEPTNARSMSFVGTHEYLAPEIIKGEGHGSAVDWWTFGIFLYELLFGKTPFKGSANRATLFNVIGQPLRFPESPTVSFAARDLIRGLLVKEPHHRLAYRRGATEIKQHPFFQNVNWALIRCATPPEVPRQVMNLPQTEKDLGVKPSGYIIARICYAPILSRCNRRFCIMASSAAVVDEAKHGFSRPEMYKENLAGTVDAYDRHVFLCYKNCSVWPPRIEASDADPLPKRVASVWKSRKNDIAVKTKITVCEAREEAGFADGDVLIFPDMIKYKGLEESNVDGFFDDVIVSGKEWSIGGEHSVLRGSHIFVCAHGSRDVRCGVCGPVLMDKLNEEIQLRGLKDQISVVACSHVGGHKYAGNVIIFCPGPDGKITGHWYGYVTPDDVPALLDRQIAKGEVIQKLWRGQMGPPNAEIKVADDDKLANGDYDGKASLSNNENVGGCCQGANGVSCCRSASFEQNKDIDNKTAEAYKRQGSNISCNWPSLQKRDILTATAILGALAAVAVAYRFYRRSS